MDQQQLQALRELLIEHDLIVSALANLDAGCTPHSVGIHTVVGYVPHPPPFVIPPQRPGRRPVTVPLVAECPAALTAALRDYLTARQTTVRAELDAQGATYETVAIDPAQVAPLPVPPERGPTRREPPPPLPGRATAPPAARRPPPRRPGPRIPGAN